MAFFGTQRAQASPAQAAPQQEGPNPDMKVANSPTDTVSQLRFSPPQQNGNAFLMASSWDTGVYIYEVQRNGQSSPVSKYNHDKPVLCCEWMPGGTSVVSADVEGNIALKDIQSGSMTQMGKHDAGVSGISYIEQHKMVMTCSYDKTVKYWDGRQQQPTAQVALTDRAFCMDTIDMLGVVACADKSVAVFNFTNPTQIFKHDKTNLSYQTRSVSCFRGGQGGKGMGYAIGSIEGRVAICYLDPPKARYGTTTEPNYFTFRCHRTEKEEGTGWNKTKSTDVHPVNSIAFNGAEGTFATVGGDGLVKFWDHENRQRIHKFSYSDRRAVTTCSFSKDSRIFAYAQGYDWSQGHQGSQGQPSQIMLKGTMADNPNESLIKFKKKK